MLFPVSLWPYNSFFKLTQWLFLKKQEDRVNQFDVFGEIVQLLTVSFALNPEEAVMLT
jgi:hypothetical protein